MEESAIPSRSSSGEPEPLGVQVAEPVDGPNRKNSGANGNDEAEPDIASESLVEDVSIDGMCGVY